MAAPSENSSPWQRSFTWGSLDAASGILVFFADSILGSTTRSVWVFLASEGCRRLQLARAASARVVKCCSDWVVGFVCECTCRQNTLASGQRCCTCDFEGVFGTRWLLIESLFQGLHEIQANPLVSASSWRNLCCFRLLKVCMFPADSVWFQLHGPGARWPFHCTSAVLTFSCPNPKQFFALAWR